MSWWIPRVSAVEDGQLAHEFVEPPVRARAGRADVMASSAEACAAQPGKQRQEMSKIAPD